MEWSFESARAEDATESRRQFVSLLRAMGCTCGDFDAAELIFGELAGNVVKHARGRVRIVLGWSAEHAMLTIHDDHHAIFADGRLPDDPMQETGRGLYIVRTLARSFSIRRTAGDGTNVVAVLPVWRT